MKNENRSIDFYFFENARIYITWKNKTQPLGFFKTARKAAEKIKALECNKKDLSYFKIIAGQYTIDAVKAIAEL